MKAPHDSRSRRASSRFGDRADPSRTERDVRRRVLTAALIVLGLSACDSVRWQHEKCRSEADAAVRAVSALERRRECNSPEQCASVERERAGANELRRESQLFACMRSQGFEFDAERWALDRREQRERSGHRYWSRRP
jgi:hypothetical protein